MIDHEEIYCVKDGGEGVAGLAAWISGLPKGAKIRPFGEPGNLLAEWQEPQTYRATVPERGTGEWILKGLLPALPPGTRTRFEYNATYMCDDIVAEVEDTDG